MEEAGIPSVVVAAEEVSWAAAPTSLVEEEAEVEESSLTETVEEAVVVGWHRGTVAEEVEEEAAAILPWPNAAEQAMEEVVVEAAVEWLPVAEMPWEVVAGAGVLLPLAVVGEVVPWWPPEGAARSRQTACWGQRASPPDCVPDVAPLPACARRDFRAARWSSCHRRPFSRRTEP